MFFEFNKNKMRREKTCASISPTNVDTRKPHVSRISFKWFRVPAREKTYTHTPRYGECFFSKALSITLAHARGLHDTMKVFLSRYVHFWGFNSFLKAVLWENTGLAYLFIKGEIFTPQIGGI